MSMEEPGAADFLLQPFDPRKKQTDFENKIVRATLTAAGANVSSMLAWSHAQEGTLDCAWFNEMFGDAPMAIEGRKLRNEIDFPSFFKGKFTRNEVWDTYVEARQNYSDRQYFGLVFDRHRDNLAEMILHNHPLLTPDPEEAKSGAWMVLVHDEQVYYVQYWKHFLTRLTGFWNINK